MEGDLCRLFRPLAEGSDRSAGVEQIVDFSLLNSCIRQLSVYFESAWPLRDLGYHAFLYDRSVFTDLGTLGGSASFAFGMNNQGAVVGYASLVGDEAFDAFLWTDGVMLDLGRLPGDFFAQASGVNQRGEVVGTSVGLLPRAFVWRNGAMLDLNSLISHESNWALVLAQAINQRGQIVGGGVHNGEAHAFLLTPRLGK